MPDKGPMIDKESRPSPIDYEASIHDWKVRDLLAVVRADAERMKQEPELIKPEWQKPEHLKPERFKPEQFKPEHFKPERFKPEQLKPEQLKPEKEGLKPEKEVKPDWDQEFEVLVDQLSTRLSAKLGDQIANQVVDVLRKQGVIR